MQYRRLGTYGLKVSRLAFGYMSFGDTSRGFSEWVLDDAEAEPVFRQALELGSTFWDTANAYGYGTSEEIVGRAIRKYTRREDIVLATKVYFTMHDGPGGSGLSRKAIMEQIDASLARLGTDYVDLYQIHRFDPEVPAEEIMEGAARRGQGGQNPVYRRVVDVGVAVLQAAVHRRAARMGQVRVDAESVQPDAARGGAGDVRAARRPGRGQHPVEPAGQGAACAAVRGTDQAVRDRPGRPPVLRRRRPAGHRRRPEGRTGPGIPMAQVALAWVLRNPVVAAPIVGPTNPRHLADAAAALEVDLTGDEARTPEEPYTLREPTGF